MVNIIVGSMYVCVFMIGFGALHDAWDEISGLGKRVLITAALALSLFGCGRPDTFSATRCISCEGKLACFDTPNVPDPFTCHYIEGQGYTNVPWVKQ